MAAAELKFWESRSTAANTNPLSLYGLSKPLTVSATGTGGNGFVDWIANYPGVGAQRSFIDDPDGDGLVSFTVQVDTPVTGTTTVTATITGAVIPDKLFVDLGVTQLP